MSEDDARAVKGAFLGQIAIGIDRATALNLAVIVYQQRHPFDALDSSQTIVRNYLSQA